jgi:hypothetical protein
MQFTRTRRPLVVHSLRSRALPPTGGCAAPLVAESRSPQWLELLGACSLIAAFLVMAMFG